MIKSFVFGDHIAVFQEDSEEFSFLKSLKCYKDSNLVQDEGKKR